MNENFFFTKKKLKCFKYAGKHLRELQKKVKSFDIGTILNESKKRIGRLEDIFILFTILEKMEKIILCVLKQNWYAKFATDQRSS